jgi:hypothetical protein
MCIAMPQINARAQCISETLQGCCTQMTAAALQQMWRLDAAGR